MPELTAVLQGKAVIGAIVHRADGDYRVVEILSTHASITPNASASLALLEPVARREKPVLRLVKA